MTIRSTAKLRLAAAARHLREAIRLIEDDRTAAQVITASEHVASALANLSGPNEETQTQTVTQYAQP